MEVLHCGNRNLLLFGSCDLELDLMNFTYKLDPYSLEIYQMCKYELHMSTFSKVIVWQTNGHHRNYIPRRFASGNWSALRAHSSFPGPRSYSEPLFQ